MAHLPVPARRTASRLASTFVVAAAPIVGAPSSP